jgi:uncharacterized protein YuzE
MSYFLSIEAEEVEGKVRVVQLNLRREIKTLWSTSEILPDVFVDYDANGSILAIEFLDPSHADSAKMTKISSLTGIPMLAALDISKLATY